MEIYSFTSLSNLIGEKVTLTDEHQNSVSLVISEVNYGPLHGAEWESFSVIYTSEKPIEIPQGTFTFHHQSFGQKKLFLSPNSYTEFETVVTRSRQHQEEKQTV